ncbi:hypothetical protein PPERSA_05112 [Pseudocohnilembus persalinus]|uniref:Uncharacterized protein n=1 Tax=Pseudocohnilembus persalinus TaxID=266149 RepID=A0A0V0QVQ8_PSEPJ|nr:hypothetical protein PPERSA_05112 [Pseudocohnilembus persalinus]|eukprot:KRX06499.1 hypothetical protein PPERSA_05112 [Pseudocohnilembus persalinus]
MMDVKDYLQRKERYADSMLNQDEYRKIPKILDLDENNEQMNQLQAKLQARLQDIQAYKLFKKNQMDQGDDFDQFETLKNDKFDEDQDEQEEDLKLFNKNSNNNITDSQRFIKEENLIQFMQKKDQYNKQLNKEYKEKAKQIEAIRGVAGQEYINLFGADRGRCNYCTFDKCQIYKASYNINNIQGTDVFSCLNCGCPMNSHQILEVQQTFSNDLSTEIQNKYVETQHLNFQSIVAIFYLDTTKSKNYYRSKLLEQKEYAQYKQRYEDEEREMDLEQMVQVLNEGCFDILSYYDMTLDELQEKMIEKKIFSQKRPVQKSKFDDLHSFIVSLIQTERQISKDAKVNLKKVITDDKDLEKYLYYEYLKEKIVKKIQILRNQNPQDQKIIVLLLSSKYQDPYQQFKTFLETAEKNLPQNMKLFYHSKYKYKGIIDTQLYFSQFFKIHLSSFLLMQHLPNQLQKQYKKKLNFFHKSVSYRDQQEEETRNEEEIKQRFYEQIYDKFEDILDFNSFEKIEEDLQENTREQFIDSFSFMQKELLNNFFLFMTSQNKKIPLVIAQKIGPPLLSMISNNPPNFYRITDQFENQSIMNTYCQGLGVKEQNFDDYVRYMRDGLVSIILLSKPGAISQSKLIANGCQKGLKMQQTNFLDDLYKEHRTDTGYLFKEKVQKQFFNIYQSQQNINLFNGIKDFFSLERLVFQNGGQNDVQNMFINERHNKVFFKKPNEVKQNEFSQKKRSRLMKDINKESYNFFMYSTDDEMKTQQVCQMFMPDCSSIQQVLVIIKPAYRERQVDIQRLLERMKFKVYMKQPSSSSDRQQLEKLLHSLEVLKLPEDRFKKLLQNFGEQNGLFVGSLVKPAGKKEMKSFLKGFKIESVYDQQQKNQSKNQEFEDLNQKEHLEIEDLKEMLIPCWNDISHKIVQGFLNPSSSQFDAFKYEQMNTYDKIFCLNYMLQVTFAVDLQSKKLYDESPEEKNPYQTTEIKNPLYENKFINIKVKAKEIGKFEIRIMKFSSTNINNLDLNEVRSEFKLLSWYYSLVNVDYQQRSPLCYQSRIFPEEIQLNEKPSHVFDVQEFNGDFFMETIAKFFRRFRRAEEYNEKKKIGQNYVPRSSLVAYMWGRKLAFFVKEMENIKFENILGFGPIQFQEFGKVFQGKIKDQEGKWCKKNASQFKASEYSYYIQIIKKLMNKREEMIFPDKFEQKLKEKLNVIFDSEIYYYSRDHKMRRIQPKFITNENLRVRDNVQQIHTKQFGDFLFLDERHERQDNYIQQLEKKVQKSEKDHILLQKSNKQVKNEKLNSNNNFYNLEDNNFNTENQEFDEIDKQFNSSEESDDSEENLEFKKYKNPNYDIKRARDLEEKQKKILQRARSDKLNTFSLSYITPEIRSKYAFAANVKFFLKIYLQKLRKNDRFQEDLFTDNPEYYDLLIEAIIHGFDNNYTMDAQDIQFLEEQYQTNKMRKDQMTVPDLINAELYLIILQYIEFLMDSQSKLDLQLDDLESNKQIYLEKQKKMQQRRTDYIAGRQFDQMQYNQISDEEINYNKQIEIANQRKIEMKQYLKQLIDLVNSNDPVIALEFDYEKSRAIQNKMLEKQEILRGQYFVPSQKQDSFIAEDLDNPRYKVDILNTHTQKAVLKKYGDAVFFRSVNTDPIQKQWFNRAPLEIAHIRPPQEGQEKERKFILVNKGAKIDSKVDQAVDNEIMRFKEQMRLKNENQKNQKMANNNNYSNNSNYAKEQVKKQNYGDDNGDYDDYY